MQHSGSFTRSFYGKTAVPAWLRYRSYEGRGGTVRIVPFEDLHEGLLDSQTGSDLLERSKEGPAKWFSNEAGRGRRAALHAETGVSSNGTLAGVPAELARLSTKGK